VPNHFGRVGSQITGCSNLYPLNASQSVSKIWLLVFTVSCFAVNKRALTDPFARSARSLAARNRSTITESWLTSARDFWFQWQVSNAQQH
jgi:hypothetical protein